jgi:acetoacetate decarboxylase
MSIPMDRIPGMPAFSPYYPVPPAQYRNVQFQFVSFRADPARVSEVLPDCLGPAEDGLCVGIGISVPWCSSYGSFQESVLAVKCTYRAQDAWFIPIAFLNSRSSIPAGREVYGTPKVFAEVEVGMDERVRYTHTDVAGTRIFSIRSTMDRPLAPDDLPNLKPSYRLKAIPRADGNGLDVLQLIDAGSATTDVTVHVSRSGDGVVQFNPSPVYDLTGLAPLEHFGACYAEMDYTEGYAEVVHDFLAE